MSMLPDWIHVLRPSTTSDGASSDKHGGSESGGNSWYGSVKLIQSELQEHGEKLDKVWQKMSILRKRAAEEGAERDEIREVMHGVADQMHTLQQTAQAQAQAQAQMLAQQAQFAQFQHMQFLQEHQQHQGLDANGAVRRASHVSAGAEGRGGL
jgi:hypothetical protein